ncbi:glucosamine-6-phosphate deaminase [Devosia sp.]|jgi:glucosamine-6-phosphate deaminase|uniref:glucosamine-6-phosphate deaminase n=1 Tax=Devosia sp. TaxID=1871048 RepID=UPI0037C19BD5
MLSSYRPDPSKTERRVDQLLVKSYSTRQDMGAAAATEIASELRRLLSSQAAVRMIFASAPSQSDVLGALVRADGIDWSRVTAFHMDEYIGLTKAAPQRFANWLDEFVFSKLPLAAAHRIDPGANPAATARDYAQLLSQAPIDLVQLGIGVNGHIAFNDPPVADFGDPLDVKVVDLDLECRQQQVDDDCFSSLADVPAQAITLTVPRLLRANKLFCMVPTRAKRAAVNAALNGPIAESCPASVLRRHPDCTLYLDADSDPEM